ncbi:MAG TPA: hypothetical protein VHX39_04955, partial [Acetobacteraceae bacterium]|nr:hypothetical protein [Acetobacteraceae bacterium]
MKKLTPQYAVLALLLLWALLAEGAFSIHFVYGMAVAGRQVPFPFRLHSYTNRIESVMAEYQNGPLRRGDEILGVNGRELRGRQDLDRFRNELQAGQLLRVSVRRKYSAGTSDKTYFIRLQDVSSRTLGWVALLTLMLLPFSCLVIGFFIAFVRPDDGLAWITMAMLASFGQI